MAEDPIGLETKTEEGVPEIPQVTVDRSSAEELDKARMQRTQTTCLFILALATGLGLAYVAKLVLVVLLSSVLVAFVLAPVVDFGIRMRLPRPLSALLAVFLMVGILYGIAFTSYSKAVDFMQDLPKYSRELKGLGAKFQKRAEALRKSTEGLVPESPEDKKAVTIRQSSSFVGYVDERAGIGRRVGVHDQLRSFPRILHAELAGTRARQDRDAVQDGEPQHRLRDHGTDVGDDPQLSSSATCWWDCS